VLCVQGTLREALDRRTLHGPGIKYLPRESIVCLCHDIAAALLHLHSQGEAACNDGALATGR
jgi:hypothetical protein